MAGFIVVVGASAGGVHALRALVGQLPSDFPAPVLVVLHIGAHPSILPSILALDSRLPVRHAVDGEPLHPGVVVVAPPDCHLQVEADRLRLVRGPREHHTRPAIDPLFRSAALAHGPCVIGVVLTGTLDDGTAGLQAIKRHGGIAVVQDPADADEPDMPLSALRYVAVDHCLPLERIPALLDKLVRSRKGGPVMNPSTPPTPDARHDADEQALSDGGVDAIPLLATIARPTTFTCPDCHGVLWEIDASRPPRYRCHTGHAFSLRTLAAAQSDAVDGAVWSAMRALQEQAALSDHQAEVAAREHDEVLAGRCRARADHLRAQVQVLRGLLVTDR